MTERIKNSKLILYIKKFLSSRFFPFVSAAVTLACYYLSLDIVTVCYIGVTGALILLLLDDVSPILNEFLYVGVFISFKNSPSTVRGNSDYFFRPEILTFLVISIALLAAGGIYRFVVTFTSKKFKPTPVLYGLCGFAAAVCLGGVGVKNYDPLNLMFAAFMILFLPVMFVVLKDNVTPCKQTYEKIALSFLAFSILLVTELVVVYATKEGIFVDGKVNRGLITFGWGVYTTYGMLVTLCLPAVVYLASIYKYGFILTAYSVVVFAACFMCCCRQSMLAAGIIYPICLVLLYIKSRNRYIDLAIITVAAIAGIVVAGIYQDIFLDFFKVIFNNLVIEGQFNGSGRGKLWREAIANFKSRPIFGVGFYVPPFPFTPKGFNLTPPMYHNTILELMSAAGIVGLAAYLVHRVQTVISYFKNVTYERTFIVLSGAAILICSLLDNHIFALFPTLTYCLLVAVLVKSEKKSA